MTQRELIEPAKIHPAIIAIMREVGPIAKDQKNNEQKYSFRGVDQVYNACHPLFAANGVYSTSEVLHAEHREGQNAKGTKLTHAILKMRFTYWAEDGSSVSTEVVGEGIDYSGDKASNKAMSAADKYALLQLLKIPTAMIDSDREPFDNPEHDRKTPKTDTRQKRKPVTKEDVFSLMGKFSERFAVDVKAEPEKFVAWVHQTTNRTFNVRSSAEWSQNDVSQCLLALDVPPTEPGSPIPF